MIPLIMLACSMAFLADASDLKAEKEVLAAMNAWKQAMITRDRAALEALYAPKLIYLHSNGRQESKAEAIDSVVNGRSRYESIDMEDVSVSTYDKTAIVKAKVTMRINNGTSTNTLILDILHVWIKMPSGWQMAARHAARLNPP